MYQQPHISARNNKYLVCFRIVKVAAKVHQWGLEWFERPHTLQDLLFAFSVLLRFNPHGQDVKFEITYEYTGEELFLPFL